MSERPWLSSLEPHKDWVFHQFEHISKRIPLHRFCICRSGGTFWNYHKVASSNTSRWEAHAGFFRLLMMGIFDPYVINLNSVGFGRRCNIGWVCLDIFWHRKLTLKVRILPFLTTFAQLSARLKNFLGGWLLVLGIKEGLVECATVCVKSVVILWVSILGWRYL
jgi:hypothetical protein